MSESSVSGLNNSVDDSSSSSDDSEMNLDTNTTRPKRQAQWSPNTNLSSVCHWPPDPENEEEYPIWKSLHPKPPGNPKYGPRMQLFSATGWNLGIYEEKQVKGSQDEFDRFTFLELSYGGIPGHIRIQCIENQLYLAMNNKGRLYGEREKSTESTIFIESLQGSYNTYLSKNYAHLGWYLGLKKSGKPKKGSKTGYNQKAVKFLPRRSNFN